MRKAFGTMKFTALIYALAFVVFVAESVVTPYPQTSDGTPPNRGPDRPEHMKLPVDTGAQNSRIANDPVRKQQTLRSTETEGRTNAPDNAKTAVSKEDHGRGAKEDSGHQSDSSSGRSMDTMKNHGIRIKSATLDQTWGETYTTVTLASGFKEDPEAEIRCRFRVHQAMTSGASWVRVKKGKLGAQSGKIICEVPTRVRKGAFLSVDVEVSMDGGKHWSGAPGVTVGIPEDFKKNQEEAPDKADTPRPPHPSKTDPETPAPPATSSSQGLKPEKDGEPSSDKADVEEGSGDAKGLGDENSPPRSDDSRDRSLSSADIPERTPQQKVVSTAEGSPAGQDEKQQPLKPASQANPAAAGTEKGEDNEIRRIKAKESSEGNAKDLLDEDSKMDEQAKTPKSRAADPGEGTKREEKTAAHDESDLDPRDGDGESDGKDEGHETEGEDGNERDGEDEGEGEGEGDGDADGTDAPDPGKDKQISRATVSLEGFKKKPEGPSNDKPANDKGTEDMAPSHSSSASTDDSQALAPAQEDKEDKSQDSAADLGLARLSKRPGARVTGPITSDDKDDHPLTPRTPALTMDGKRIAAPGVGGSEKSDKPKAQDGVVEQGSHDRGSSEPPSEKQDPRLSMNVDGLKQHNGDDSEIPDEPENTGIASLDNARARDEGDSAARPKAAEQKPPVLTDLDTVNVDGTTKRTGDGIRVTNLDGQAVQSPKIDLTSGEKDDELSHQDIGDGERDEDLPDAAPSIADDVTPTEGQEEQDEDGWSEERKSPTSRMLFRVGVTLGMLLVLVFGLYKMCFVGRGKSTAKPKSVPEKPSFQAGESAVSGWTRMDDDTDDYFDIESQPQHEAKAE